MPEAPVSRLEHLKTLRYANLDGAFASAFGSLVGGAFIVSYVKHLNGSDYWIGLFTAIPSLIGLLQIVGAIWGRGFKSFKPFVTPGGLLWRLLHIPLIFIPFLNISTDAKLAIMLVSVGLAAVAVQLVGPIYNDWLAEMIPANSRGWFFSRRNAILAVVGAFASFGAGFCTDYFKRTNQIDLGFSVTCGLGVALGLVSMYYYMLMRDLPRPNPIRISVRTGLRAMSAPFIDRDFRKVLAFFIAAVIAQSFAGNFFSAYAFESIGMSMSLLQVTAICHATGNVLASRFWGFVGDKYGNKPLLAILMVGIAITPLQWIFLRPGADLFNGVLLGVGHIFTGMCWSGVALAQFNLLLATAKEDDRANYIGAGMALQAAMGAVGPILGAILMEKLRHSMPVASAYHTIFLVTGLLRLLSLLLLVPVKEIGSTSIRGTISELSRVSPAGFMTLRKITKTENAQVREQAIATAGDSQLALARTDVIRALEDPSPRVRRQAAASLAKIGGSEAVEALLNMLRNHPSLVDDEVIEALGQLGNSVADVDLAPYLHSPRPSIRRATAKALGQIGGPLAVKALIEAAQEGSDPDVRRAALQGLRRLESKEASEVFAQALIADLPSLRISAAEAVADLEIREAADTLRESMRLFHDEGTSEVAYALGRVGNLDDLPSILREAARSGSVTSRRRALLGAAHLLGVESEVYRLFLYESMSLDSELLGLIRPALRRHPELTRALELFSSDREQEAVDFLATIDPRLAPFRDAHVQDAFIVAVVAAATSH